MEKFLEVQKDHSEKRSRLKTGKQQASDASGAGEKAFPAAC